MNACSGASRQLVRVCASTLTDGRKEVLQRQQMVVRKIYCLVRWGWVLRMNG